MPESAFDHRWLPPEGELSERFVLASGPGGQHVNRTASAVQLRFDARRSAWLPREMLGRLLRLAGKRADADGVITIEAKSQRSQYRNREEARQRLAELIEKASHRPKKRIPTRPTRASKRRRLEGKRHRADVKKRRKAPGMG
jgi:ribosome-associated protein